MLPIRRISIIGFGEAGGILGSDLAKQGIQVSVFDILLDSKRTRPELLAKAQLCGVKVANDLGDCIRNAEVVISAVSASAALTVAKNAAPALGSGQTYLDINSVSPQTKRLAADHVNRRHARYVEAAVMDAVPKHRLKVPMLLGGPHAAKFSKRLKSIGMNAIPLSAEIGVVSAVKMCRSIIVKGLEALTVECLFAARQYGAEEAVLQSLAATYPGIGWREHFSDYLIARVAEHGRRRAEEMREVAQALNDVTIDPIMALATARRQEWLVREMARKRVYFDPDKQFSWSALADAIVRRDKHSSLRHGR